MKKTNRDIPGRYLNSLLTFCILLISAAPGLAQEHLTGLSSNPVIKAYLTQHPYDVQRPAGTDTIPVALPFFDDFSSSGIFPSSLRWIDRYAFEGDDLPIFPVNLGAITLDAVNDSGNMYQHATPGPQPFIADMLTSKYIRLDSLFSPVPRAMTPADSVYFSFYYQPQGRGRSPQSQDSLILEFLVKPAHDSITVGGTINIPDKWQRMWYSNGMPLDTFYTKYNRWFVQVMIPVTDTVFFSKKFRFRFFNYASLASSSEPSWQSNTDHWNIDNVYLNAGRNMHDTLRTELSFIYRPPSLLKRYESMPYPHYADDPTNEIKDTLDILMSNRDVVSRMAVYGYKVSQEGGSFVKSYDGGNYNIQPYTINPYVTYEKFAHPPLPFLIPVSQADSAVFMMQHIVRENVSGSVIGDTMTGYQRFYNYFAYDDGSPEASYGLTPAGSKLAYKFKMNKSPDTLRAIRIYFNKTLSQASQQLFYLCVWNDNAGKPGDTIYSDLVQPRFADSINKFVTYHLDPAPSIAGTFYVGWIQTTDDNLSVGFDRYNNSQQSIFYNVNGTWSNSSFAGSLLIRPVVGKPIPVGIGDVEPSTPALRVYPNPCSSVLYLKTGVNRVSEPVVVTISDLSGRILRRITTTERIDVSDLNPGMYLAEVKEFTGKRLGVIKFIKSR